MQFHTKVNGFQQLAYWLVMMSEILGNTLLLEMGFKYKKLQYKFQKFHVSQQEIVASEGPIISTFLTTELVLQHPVFRLLITHLQQTEIFSTHIP